MPGRHTAKLNWIHLHMLLRIFCACQDLAAEPLLVTAMCGGDATAAMRMLASSSLGAGIIQFLLNPTFGTLSDRFGRKPFFLVGPLCSVFFNALIALQPSARTLFFCLRTAGKTLSTLSGSTVCSAAISDCVEGDELSIANARQGAAVGLGVVVAPLLGNLVLSCGFAPRVVYWCQALSSVAHTLTIGYFLQETLDHKEQRKHAKIPLRFVNPLQFIRLFTSGRKLALMSASSGLACFADGGNLNDIEQMWIRTDVHDMGLGLNSVYLSLWGVAGSCGGMIVPYLLRTLGKRGYTTFTTLTNMTACLLWGAIPRAWAVFAALALHFPGINTNSALCIKSAATQTAIVHHGMGRGEFAGYFGNLRAITAAIGPFVYGQLYALGRTAYPGRNLGFWAAALLGCAIPEALHQLLGPEDLEVAAVD